jgi:DNA-binding GntR family transcriptional regulator
MLPDLGLAKINEVVTTHVENERRMLRRLSRQDRYLLMSLLRMVPASKSEIFRGRQVTTSNHHISCSQKRWTCGCINTDNLRLPVGWGLLKEAFTMALETTPESAIPRQSLTSAVADKLRDQIIRGVIAEGTQLRQDAIASQFQVSRIPVREALRQLDAEGLIAIVPNRGAVVPALSPDDIVELFTIRALLEPEVLKRSIPHLTEEDFAKAEAILRTYVRELRRDDHVSGWGRLNWQFHSTLYARADQPRFMAIIRNVNNSGERYTRLQLYLTHGTKRANQEHHRILELCRRREVAAACKLLREHIEYAGQSLKQALQERRNSSQGYEAP